MVHITVNICCVLLYIYPQVRVIGRIRAQMSSMAPQHNTGLLAIWADTCRSWARTRCSITEPGPLQRPAHPGTTEAKRKTQPHQPLKHTSRFRLPGGAWSQRERGGAKRGSVSKRHTQTRHFICISFNLVVNPNENLKCINRWTRKRERLDLKTKHTPGFQCFSKTSDARFQNTALWSFETAANH